MAGFFDGNWEDHQGQDIDWEAYDRAWGVDPESLDTEHTGDIPDTWEDWALELAGQNSSAVE